MDECSSESSAGDDERMQTPATCFRRLTKRIWTRLFRIHRKHPPPPDTSMRLKLPSCLDFVSCITPSHPQRKGSNDVYSTANPFTVHSSFSSLVTSGGHHETRVLLHNPSDPQIDQQNESEPRVTEVQNSPTHPPAQLHHINPSSGLGPSPGDRPVSHVSVPSLMENLQVKENLRRILCVRSMVSNSSFKEFTPVTVGEMDEAYRFQSSCPGLYQCSVTGLVFGMETEGVVVYRTVPWDHRMLDQYHKKPAGPLFDITCVDKSVVQLHLPHCELRLTGGRDFLSVAHMEDDGSVQFIRPQKITETHVVINITGFSPVGNVKDKDSPPDPVRALVLLFFRPSPDPDLKSVLNMLLLPKNVSLRDVKRTRKALVGDEIYIETSPHCKLQPKQVYTLTISPEDSGKVQPRDAEFYEDSYDNYFPAFQVFLTKIMTNLNLLLTDQSSSCCVWEREVCLSSTRVRGSPALDPPPDQRLLDVRSGFINGISGPVLKSLLDKLLEKKVVTDADVDEVNGMQTRADKARLVIDTVRRKGEDPSSDMIKFLCEVDPFLCSSIGLN